MIPSESKVSFTEIASQGRKETEIEIVREKIRLDRLKQMAEQMFGDLVKAVVDFDSMINIKLSTGNRTRGIDNPETRKKVISIIDELIQTFPVLSQVSIFMISLQKTEGMRNSTVLPEDLFILMEGLPEDSMLRAPDT